MEKIKNESAYTPDIFDAKVKLDNVKVILNKLTDDYGFSDKLAPTRRGVCDWVMKNGERTKQEDNSVTWVQDYEYILTMLHVIGDYVYESCKILDAEC